MKGTSLLIIAITMICIAFKICAINENLKELVKINTPEYVNVIPEKIIIDKN